MANVPAACLSRRSTGSANPTRQDASHRSGARRGRHPWWPACFRRRRRLRQDDMAATSAWHAQEAQASNFTFVRTHTHTPTVGGEAQRAQREGRRQLSVTHGQRPAASCLSCARRAYPDQAYRSTRETPDGRWTDSHTTRQADRQTGR